MDVDGPLGAPAAASCARSARRNAARAGRGAGALWRRVEGERDVDLVDRWATAVWARPAAVEDAVPVVQPVERLGVLRVRSAMARRTSSRISASRAASRAASAACRCARMASRRTEAVTVRVPISSRTMRSARARVRFSASVARGEKCKCVLQERRRNLFATPMTHCIQRLGRKSTVDVRSKYTDRRTSLMLGTSPSTRGVTRFAGTVPGAITNLPFPIEHTHTPHTLPHPHPPTRAAPAVVSLSGDVPSCERPS